MFKLNTKDGKVIEDTQEMLNETKGFYENLYSEKEVIDVDLEDYVNSLPKLSDEEAENLEGLITLDEASCALKNMTNGKSPGTDGMTVEFFKFFWKQLGGFVVCSLNEGFKKERNVNNTEGRYYNMYTKR